jgi:hypothetical protein
MTETCQIEHELFELHERKGTDGAASNLADLPRAKAPENLFLSKNNAGKRPKCFKNTFQEICFIFMATLAMATNSLVTGAMIIVTASVGRDLHMTQAQITWISAATT